MNDVMPNMDILLVFSISTIAFSAIYFLTFYFWQRTAHYIPPKDRKDKIPLLASYIPALIHGSLVAYLTVKNLFEHHDWRDFSHPNTREQSLILSMSAGYFAAVRLILDLLHVFHDYSAVILHWDEEIYCCGRRKGRGRGRSSRYVGKNLSTDVRWVEATT